MPFQPKVSRKRTSSQLEIGHTVVVTAPIAGESPTTEDLSVVTLKHRKLNSNSFTSVPKVDEAKCEQFTSSEDEVNWGDGCWKLSPGLGGGGLIVWGSLINVCATPFAFGLL